MTVATFPSPVPSHRFADMIVHVVGLCLILIAGGFLISKATNELEPKIVLAVSVYVVCGLVSNLASWAYHFTPAHDRRKLLRRIDHAAIYLSITGTFTPFFVLAGTTWTLTLLVVCWSLTVVAVWNKITNETVKSRWSTASYLGLGAIGMAAMPDLTGVPVSVLYCVISGAVCYVIGTVFYARKSLPFRYTIWHTWVNFGGILIFAGIWLAVFS